MEPNKKKFDFNPTQRGDTTMKKIAIIATIVLGTAGAAFAEDSSSSFGLNVYTQGAQQQVLTSRSVALGGDQNIVYGTTSHTDRASNPYAGGGF
jgi:hypothetical protein